MTDNIGIAGRFPQPLRCKAGDAPHIPGTGLEMPRKHCIEPPPIQGSALPRPKNPPGEFMETVVIVVHLMVVLALVGVVLLQRSEGGGLGIGGGSGFMTARGAANALTRATAILAVAFFATSLALSIIARYGAQPTDILDRVPATQGDQNGGGVLDQLGGSNVPAPPATVPPSGAGRPRPRTRLRPFLKRCPPTRRRASRLRQRPISRLQQRLLNPQRLLSRKFRTSNRRLIPPLSVFL